MSNQAPKKPTKNPAPPQKKLNPYNLHANPLDIPEWIKKEGKEKGLEFRWINGVNYQKMYGFNAAGWTPYKPDGTYVAGIGKDAEGYVRRGDLILAAKTVEDAAAHREALAIKARMYSNNVQSQKAQELRDLAGDMGVKGRIHEGYEDAGEDESDDE